MILETRGVKANAECVKNVEGLEACCLKFLISQHFRAVFSGRKAYFTHNPQITDKYEIEQ